MENFDWGNAAKGGAVGYFAPGVNPFLAAAASGMGIRLLPKKGSMQRQRRRRYEREADMATNVGQGLYDRMNAVVADDLDGMDADINAFSDVISQGEQLNQGVLSDLGKTYTDTVEGQAILNQLREQTRDQSNQLRNTGSLLGLSEEALIAGQGNIAKGQGQAMGDISARADQRRAGLRNQSADLLGLITGAARTRSGTRMGRAGMRGDMYSNAFANAFGIMGGVDRRRAQNMKNIMDGTTGAAKLAFTGGI